MAIMRFTDVTMCFPDLIRHIFPNLFGELLGNGVRDMVDPHLRGE